MSTIMQRASTLPAALAKRALPLACSMTRTKWERYSSTAMSRSSSVASSSGTTIEDLLEAFPAAPTSAPRVPEITAMAGRYASRLSQILSRKASSFFSSTSTVYDSPEYWSDISLSSSRSTSSSGYSSVSSDSSDSPESSLLDESPPFSVDDEPASDIDLNSCHPHHLIHMVSARLRKIATANDAFQDIQDSVRHRKEKRTAHWDSLTTSAKTQMRKDSLVDAFRSESIPPISIERYLLGIDRVVQMPNAVLIALLVYLDRMTEWSDKLNFANSQKAFVVNSYTVHRLVLAGILAATKYHSDIVYKVGCYARSGGISKAEVRELEWQFLLLNNFEMGITLAELQTYAKELANEEDEEDDFIL